MSAGGCPGVGSIRVGTDPVGDEVCPSGPGGPALILTTGARSKLTERGIRWANVPDGRADFVVHRSQRVWHVSTPMLLLERPIHASRDGSSRGGPGGPGGGQDIGAGGVGGGYDGYSGAIKYRFRDYRNFNVPSSVNPNETRGLDRFGNPIFGGATGIDNTVHVSPQGHILDGNAVALWRFDESLASDNLVDSADSHTVLAFHNPPALSGKIAGARYVTGSSTADATLVPSLRYFQGVGDASMGATFSGSWTVEMWLNPDNHSAASNIFIYNGLQFSFVNSHTIMSEMQYDSTGSAGHILFHQWHNPSTFTAGVSSGTIGSGSWHHVAVSKQDQGGNLYTYKIYLNGQLDSTFPNISGFDFPISGSGHFIGMGNFIGITGFGIGVGNPFTGKMDDTRVSNIVRSGSEVLESYNRGIGT